MHRIQAIEGLGAQVNVYPDAEEMIQQALIRKRLRHLAQGIQTNSEKHPLRDSLLKSKLLPYQLEGSPFWLAAVVLSSPMTWD